MLKFFGFSTFKELFSAENAVEVAAIKLDIGIDLDTLKEVLDVCLTESSDGIEFKGWDLRVSDGIVQDFFDQRSKKLLERLNS